MTRPRPFTMRTVGALATVLGLGCAPGLANLHAEVRDQVARARRMFDLCQQMEQVQTATWTRSRPILGTDPQALDRVAATLTGKAGAFTPLDDVRAEINRVDSLARTLASAPAAAGGGASLSLLKDIAKTLVSRAARLRGALALIDVHAQRAEALLSELLDRLRRGRFLEHLDACAQQDLRGAVVGRARPCEPAGAADLATWIVYRRGELQDAAADLRGDVDALIPLIRGFMAEVGQLRNQLGSVPDSTTPGGADGADLLQQANFSLRQLDALGGQIEDTTEALDRLGGVTDVVGAVEAVGRALVAAEADRVADLLLLALEQAVQHVDRAIDKLDEESYGAASAAVSLGLESGVVEEAICAVGKEAKIALADAGLSSGSLGARVCKAAIGGARDFRPSPILARAYEGLIGAASDLPCAQALTDPPPKGELGRQARGAVHVASLAPVRYARPARAPERLAAATEELARATWKGRLQLSESYFAQLSAPYQFGRHAMPRLADVPPKLAAALLLIEQRERDLLRRHDNQPFEQFFMAQELVLNLSWAREPGVFDPVCREQRLVASSPVGHQLTLLPMACGTLNIDVGPSGGGGGSSQEAMRQVAWELCTSNAKVDQKAAVQELCASISDGPNASKDRKAPVLCDPAGYGAIVTSPSADFCPAEFAGVSNAKTNDLVPKTCGGNEARIALRIAADRLEPLLRNAAESSQVQFVGRTSTQPFEIEADALRFILFAVEAELQTTSCDNKELLKRLDMLSPFVDGVSSLSEKDKKAFFENKISNKRSISLCAPKAGKGDNGHEDMDDIFAHRNLVRNVKLRSLPTGDLRLDGWVTSILDKAVKIHTPAQGLSTADKKKWQQQVLSAIANEILSVFRALGAAEIALETTPELCAHATCTAEGLGVNTSADLKRDDGKHRTWRSVSVVVSRKSDVPECSRFQPSGALR